MKNHTKKEICDLVKKAQQGDRQSFNSLFDIYNNFIKSIARRYIFVGGDIEDLIQIGFIGMCEAIQKYDINSDASFKTFLYICVQAEIKNAITKSNNNKNKALHDSISLDIEVDEDDSWAYVLVSEDKTPEEQTIQKQKIKLIFDKLKMGLNEKEKSILLYYLKGYKYIEIAKKLDVDTKYVDNTLTKAKKLLQKLKAEEDL